MKKCAGTIVAAILFIMGAVAADEKIEPAPSIRVLKSNVNLRAKPNTTSETIGQVSENDALMVIRFTNEWVEVIPPQSVDLWVLGDYVKDGVIEGENVNVRAGAGINYNIVGRLDKGDAVAVRRELGPWICIAPPEKSSVWIHSSLVELIPVLPTEESQADVEKGDSVEVVDAQTDESVVSHIELNDSESVMTAVPPPADLDLVDSSVQGQRRQYEGVLRPRSFLARSPSKYRLIGYDERNRSVTLCFIKGNEVQLESLLNRHMVVRGRVYWVRRSEYPVLIPDRIILKAQ